MVGFARNSDADVEKKIGRQGNGASEKEKERQESEGQHRRKRCIEEREEDRDKGWEDSKHVKRRLHICFFCILISTEPHQNQVGFT